MRRRLRIRQRWSRARRSGKAVKEAAEKASAEQAAKEAAERADADRDAQAAAEQAVAEQDAKEAAEKGAAVRAEKRLRIRLMHSWCERSSGAG